jgi:hypothetical protein
MQLSFVGYLVGSLVINHAFFEYFYVQVGIVAVLHILVVKKMAAPSENSDGIVTQNNNCGKAA